MDMSDDESSDAGSSIAPARPDASYLQENYGYDPRDETLLKFDALITEEIEEKGKDSPINRCISPGEVSLGDEPDHDRKASIAYTIAPDMQNIPLDCDIHRFDEHDINKLLEAIHDPKEWIQNGRMFTKIVSKSIPQPEDSEQLHIRLDELLRERRALPRGVCPIRESIYEDCFNELIRQVALGSDANCGHLLLRCRDEMHHTKGAYSRLFESSESFSMRKSLRRNPPRLMEELAFAEEELEISKQEWAALTDELKRATKSISEETEKFDKQCKDELDYLNQNNIRLKKILDVVTKPGGYRWSMSQGTLGGGKTQQDPKARQSEAYWKSSQMNTSACSHLEEDINNIPLADDDPQVVIQEADGDSPSQASGPNIAGLTRSFDSLPSTFTNDSLSSAGLDPDVSPDEQEEKARLIAQVLELQNTLDDLSQRVDSVKEENLKLRSENQVLGQYIESLMSASSVFQPTSPKNKKK